MHQALRSILSGKQVEVLPERAREPVPAPAAETLYEIRFRPAGDVFRRGLDPVHLIRGLAELGELIKVEPIWDASLPSTRWTRRRATSAGPSGS